MPHSSLRKSGFVLIVMSIFVILPLCSNVPVAHAYDPGVWYLLDGLTPDAMDLATYPGTTLLFLAARGMDNSIWWRWTYTGGVWYPWNLIPGFTDVRPAIAVFNNRLYFVCKEAGTNNIWYGSVPWTGGSFSGWTKLDGLTLSAVSLDAYDSPYGSGTYLYLAARSMDDTIWYRRMDTAETWSSWVKIPGLTDVAPEMVVWRDALFFYCKESGASSIWEGSIDLILNSRWSGWNPVDGLTQSPVSLVRVSETTEPYLAMAARGMENGIWRRSIGGNMSPFPWIRLPGYTDVAPAIAITISLSLYFVCKEAGTNNIWFLYLVLA